MKLDDIAAVLPVREGSTRIHNKVLLPFGTDESLLEWKINQLKEVLPNKQIIVSTDSEKLISIAEKNEVSYSKRDSYLCQGINNAPFNEVIRGVVEKIDYNHIAWVTVVVPLMKPLEYLKAFNRYIKNENENGEFDSLVSVNLLKEYFWDDNGPLNYDANKNHTVSQDLPNLFRVTNGLYMYNKKDILKNEYFLGENPFKFIVDKVSGIDIDEIEDYDIAVNLFDYYKKSLKVVV